MLLGLLAAGGSRASDEDEDDDDDAEADDEALFKVVDMSEVVALLMKLLSVDEDRVTHEYATFILACMTRHEYISTEVSNASYVDIVCISIRNKPFHEYNRRLMSHEIPHVNNGWKLL